VLLAHVPISARAENDTVREVIVQDAHGDRVRIEAAYFLDATDLGDLLPLAGVEYVTGAESIEDTGEPHAAPNGARPDEMQGSRFRLRWNTAPARITPSPNRRITIFTAPTSRIR